MMDDDGWWWMMMDDDGWWWMMMDDDGWWWMMMDDDGWWWMMMDDVRGCNQVDWMCWSERRTTFLTLRRICRKPSYSRMWTLHSVLKVWEQPALAMYMHDMTLTILDQFHQKCTRMIRNHGTQSSVFCLRRVFIPIHQTCYGPRHLVLLRDASLQSVAGTLEFSCRPQRNGCASQSKTM